jgi:hypothetical protein
MNFFRKYAELQILALQHNAGLTASHPYASGPINWPFLLSGISFWTKNDTRQQIYLIGNLVGWWTCVVALSVFVGIIGADLLARRRGVQPIPECKSAPGLHLIVANLSNSRAKQILELHWILLHRLGIPLFPFLLNESPAVHSPLPTSTPLLCSCRRISFQLHRWRVDQLPCLQPRTWHATNAFRSLRRRH